MTLPVPNQRTWSAGDIVTAAELNSNIRDAVNFLESPPVAVLQQTSVQSCANGAFTPIAMDAEVVDSYNGHSTVSNTSRYVAQVAGWYLALGRYATGGTLDTKRMACISVTGVLQRNNELDSPDADLHTPQCDAIVFCNVGDYIELQGYQLSGGALNTNTSTTYYGCSLEIIWLHS